MDKPINCFPGYEKIVEWKDTPLGRKKIVHNMYRGTDLGLGGYVYFEPAIYENVVLVDISNMHGASIIALNKFGKYTEVFADIREANLAIKHKEFDRLRTLMGGKLASLLDNPDTDWKSIRTALKLVSNSTFGIAAASFDNPLRDSRDDNDIIALRGALFMRTLQDEVVNRGFTVAHIKTDSMKIPEATPEIVQFCMDFAKKYGYEFEFEAVYEKVCLINGSTYAAKHMSVKECERRFGYVPGENIEAEETGKLWTAVATQFQQPYVFKTLFSHEPIIFKDMCETKQVKTSIYLDFNEDLPDVSDLEEALKKRTKSINRLQALRDMLKGTGIDDVRETLMDTVLKEEAALQKNKLYLQNRLRTVSDGDELIALVKSEIAKGHNYYFVGGVGLFTPVIEGGGLLVKRTGDGYESVTGTKGYRWLESEAVLLDHMEDKIDKNYYRSLVDDAIAVIEQTCRETNEKRGTNYTYDWFVS